MTTKQALLARPARERRAKLYRGLWIVGGLLVARSISSCTGMPKSASTAGSASTRVYGFVACVALVLAAKLLRRGVMRPEDYYDR